MPQHSRSALARHARVLVFVPFLSAAGWLGLRELAARPSAPARPAASAGHAASSSSNPDKLHAAAKPGAGASGMAAAFAPPTPPVPPSPLPALSEVVRMAYRQVLDRDATPAEITARVSWISTGGGTVAALVADLAKSAEYQAAFVTGHGADVAVDSLFRHLWDRPATPAEVTKWSPRVTAGNYRQVVDSIQADWYPAEQFGRDAVPGRPVTHWDSRAPVMVVPGTGTDASRGQCLSAPAGLDGVYECGELRVAHALPAVRVLNRSRAPTLLYGSDQAHPIPTFGVYVTPPTGRAALTQVTVRVHTGRSMPEAGVLQAQATWRGSNFTPGQTSHVSLSYNALEQNTGVYDYFLVVTATYADGQTQDWIRRGRFAIVNRRNSPFGRGWWLAGLEQLVLSPSNNGYKEILWVGGDGSTRLYQQGPLARDNGIWVARNPGGRPDTLRTNTTYQDAAYVRRLRNGASIYYSADGSHIATVDVLDRHTHFWHDSGRLQAVFTPTGVGYLAHKPPFRFYYDANGRLNRVTSPDLAGNAARTVTLGPDATGRQLWIKDPGVPARQFQYGENTEPGRMTRSISLRGTTTRYEYDWGAELSRATVWMGDPARDIGYVYYNASTRGHPNMGLPVPAAQVITTIDGPRQNAADTTRFWLDRWGGPVAAQDPLGAVTTVTRGDTRFPALPTETVAPNGLRSTAEYDARGRVTSTQVINPLNDGRNSRTTVLYDDTWDAPVRIARYEVSSTGALTQLVGKDTMAYDAATGNRLWQQLGNDAGRRVNYGYYPAGSAFAGMPATVRTPANVEHGVMGDSIYYDGVGNMASTVSPTKIRTEYVNDGLGRPWMTTSPVDPAHGLFRRDSVVYDSAGRVALTVSRGPAMSIATTNPSLGAPWTTPEERLYVENVYNTYGELTAVRRWAVPDTAHVGVFHTGFEYDAAGRKTVEIDAKGMRDSTVYDNAGNVVATRSRRGYRITLAYDAANRLRTRTIPGAGVSRRDTIPAGGPNNFLFPRFGTDASGNATVANGTVDLQGDVERYSYDVMGNMLYAANRDAIVRRGYNPNGSISGDTLVIATYATRDTTQHVYGLRYAYDMAGRRTALVHPATLAPTGGWTVYNNYDPTTGALASVQDPVGTHQFAYNVAGEMTGELYPNGVTEVYAHDGEGRLRSRRLTIPGPGLVDSDSMVYDARGKMVFVQQQIGTVQNFYSGLGSLAWSRIGDGTSYTEQGYIQDALGNTATEEKFDYATQDIPQLHVRRRMYEAGTGRLVSEAGAPGWNADNTAVRQVRFDSAGNTRWSSDSRLYDGMVNTRRNEGRVSYYDPADRLRVVDMKACAWSTASIPHSVYWRFPLGATEMKCYMPRAGDRSVYEEYRYDALGRRVLVRSREICEMACLDKVTRTVWDGDRLLWEIRAGGEDPERDVTPAGQLPPYQITTGRVAYTFGAALDHPLAVHRFDYRDSLFTRYDTVQAPLSMQPLTIYPHTNWRGDYKMGTFITGERQRCARVPTTEGDLETVDGYQPGGSSEQGALPNVNGMYWYCLAAVQWSGSHIWLDNSQRGTPPGNPDFWVGSLVHNKRDLTGNLYMRNRYYDAQAGRFSQEDPIGLAGGLNAYGFAAGDPVSYSDPYGLSVDSIKVQGRIAQMNITYLRNHSRAFRRLYDELDADPKVRILIREARNEEEDQIGRNSFSPPTQPGGWSEIFLSRSFTEQANYDNARLGRDWRYNWAATLGHELGHAGGYYGKLDASCGADPNPGGTGCIIDFENTVRSQLPSVMRAWLGVRQYY
ncbi:RHS repeat-associated core domain-containing protein [Longimicrobium terrae]|uniref:RHS repeat-associated protein n=1 Tax=Longimicrobium terrae TaxID=1639882 RepID=A0A841GY54_9BACT|nr:RHS repeat-associated core domain-containing protein [Longimicrobium terrae]MBB4636305.1 RHS repeat-associated protein [Longimicrobium terrae]MBB6070701.1 RHS repeat-associated protein [Longimicrobium terrae]NNC29682.1 hypothetical protein [Longimicrobium terrae]